MPVKFAPTYSRLAELGKPSALPADWSWVGVDPDCRQRVLLRAAVARKRANRRSHQRFTAVLGGIRGVAGGRVATATSDEAAQAPRRQGVFLTRIAPMPEIVRPPTSYCTFLLPLCRLAI